MKSKQDKRVKTLGVGVGVGVGVVEGDDRISALPDHILCQILSRLSTKESAQTSVLSKRWKDLFASVPIIDCLFIPQRGGAANGNFVAFIYRLLYLIGLRSSHIHSFCITFPGYRKDLFRKTKIQPLVGRNIISSWISTVVSFNVQELSFYLDVGSSLPLPLPLFSCKSLTVLKLEGKFLLIVPEHVSLPSLNTLWLTDAVIYDDNSVKRLLSGCPLLEDLTLNSCNVENIKVFDMSYPSVKKFAIHCRGDYELTLNDPNLERLEITSYGATRWSGDAFNPLIEVSINLEVGGNEEVSQAKIHEIVNKACHVQKLSLRGNTMEGLAYALHSLPIFHALTYLDLSIRYNKGWKSLPTLLERSPCLETLILRGFHNNDKQFPLPHVPICFSMRLKTIQLNYFYAGEVEFVLVEYILAEAMILENMTIYGIYPRDDRFQMTRERLLTFSTYSKTCRIFVGPYEGCKTYQIM